MRNLDIDIINQDIERLEKSVRATLARIRNLKAMKQHLIREQGAGK